MVCRHKHLAAMNTSTDSQLNRGENDLLVALPSAEWFRFSYAFELVRLPQGSVLCDSGGRSEYVYFPTTAVVSLLHATRDGHCIEIAAVGKDGMVGISAFLGGSAPVLQAMVHSEGHAFRLPARIIKEQSDCGGSILKVLLRYAQTLMMQIAQTAACNRHHTVDQQLCRRLLCSLDHQPAQDIAITQEVIANLLGVRRESITAAALKLQVAGVIRYNRGRIEVLDRQALEHRACECYAVTKGECSRLRGVSTVLRIAA
jgi:CRP-like cAMP-binding protein